MTMTQLSPQHFLEEARRFGITASSLIRIRMMKKSGKVYCKFAIPNTAEEVYSIISEEEFNKIDYMTLTPISVPAVWKVE